VTGVLLLATLYWVLLLQGWKRDLKGDSRA
jgi:hypothetical protein